jgi:acetoacetyl-CoA synthetase
MNVELEMNDPLWEPDEEQIENANLTAFIRRIREKYKLEWDDYARLYRWSIEFPELFWQEVWKFTGIISERKWNVVLTNGDQMPGARWFSGAQLNFAKNLLRYNDEGPAIIFRNEAGLRREIDYRTLSTQVGLLAEALHKIGVAKGDRVAGFMPNIPETIIAMLAASSLGAIWSSCSSEFGVQGVLARFGQIEPRVLFVADGCRYSGKILSLLPKVSQIAAQLPSLKATVVVSYVTSAPNIHQIPGAVSFESLVRARPVQPPDFVSLPFDHPLYILYSSGTTGLPKSIVHGAGGTLIQHLKELVLHTDLKRQDRIFYYTTCGWMMWNWLVSSLAVGATVMLYDGSPFHPNIGVLFEIAEQEKITVFGTSARYLSALEKSGLRPGARYNLENLRAILSTGSPLAPQSFDFVYGSIKKNLCLSSISGGTDIISCFALGNPIGAVWRGELQTRGLGMSVKIFDENGDELKKEKGELVCTKPFPSMPVSFWKDEDGSRYREAYFNRFPNVWHHGDYAELTEHGGLIIHGRSDAALNPGGIRIGTAEIYRIVETIPEITESICVGQDWQGDIRIVLFVRLAAGRRLDPKLQSEIRKKIRDQASPRHVPAKIIQVADIPRTISGKLTEIAVRDMIHGREVRNMDSVANPESLGLYADIPELKS